MTEATVELTSPLKEIVERIEKRLNALELELSGFKSNWGHVERDVAKLQEQINKLLTPNK